MRSWSVGTNRTPTIASIDYNGERRNFLWMLQNENTGYVMCFGLNDYVDACVAFDIVKGTWQHPTQLYECQAPSPNSHRTSYITNWGAVVGERVCIK